MYAKIMSHLSTLIVALIGAVVGMVMAVVLMGVLLAPVVAASEPGCTPMGTVGNETLYFCTSDYVACVWDPSPALGAGVMSCEW